MMDFISKFCIIYRKCINLQANNNFYTCDNMIVASKSLDLAQKAIREVDKLWSEGVINENIIEEWKHEHMRTGYK